MRVEVENILNVSYYSLVAEFVVVEALREEMITFGLEVQKILWKQKETAYNLRPSELELIK